MEFGLKGYTCKKVTVTDVEHTDSRTTRKQHFEPIHFRATRFKADGKSFLSYIEFSKEHDNWPEFVEDGDQCTFSYQPSLLNHSHNLVLIYINHSKNDDTRSSARSSFILLMLFLLTAFSLVTLTTGEAHILEYLASTVFLSTFIYRAMKSSYRDKIKAEFCSTYGIKQDTQNKPDGKSKKQFLDSYFSTSKPNKELLSASSQGRYLLNTFGSNYDSCYKAPAPPPGMIIKEISPPPELENKSFGELSKIQHDYLWRLTKDGEIIGVMIVDEQIENRVSTTYCGYVYSNAPVRIEDSEHYRITHSRSSEEDTTSSTLIRPETLGYDPTSTITEEEYYTLYAPSLVKEGERVYAGWIDQHFDELISSFQETENRFSADTQR